MAKTNTKYAVYALIGIVVLSLFLYQNSSATGKQISEPTAVCSSIYNPTSCEASSCTWSSQYGCTDSSGAQPPGTIDIPLPVTDPCTGLPWWQCLLKSECQWYNGKCVKKGGISVYDHCKNNVKDADESDIDCGGIIGPPYCQKCADGKNCLLNSDCQSDFCDTVANMQINQGTPTYKCKACTVFNKDDNIQNCGETGIDCPDWNYPCECFNGKLDAHSGLNETEIDCSSDNYPEFPPGCPICVPFLLIDDKRLYGAPHCADGVLNKGEVCTDCEGTCSSIPFWGEVPYCCTDELTCEKNNGWWCPYIGRCFEGEAAQCYQDKETCETEGYIWCGQSGCWEKYIGVKYCEYTDACINNGVDFWCYTSKQSCENAGYYWCSASQRCMESAQAKEYVNYTIYIDKSFNASKLTESAKALSNLLVIESSKEVGLITDDFLRDDEVFGFDKMYLALDLDIKANSYGYVVYDTSTSKGYYKALETKAAALDFHFGKFTMATNMSNGALERGIFVKPVNDSSNKIDFIKVYIPEAILDVGGLNGAYTPGLTDSGVISIDVDISNGAISSLGNIYYLTNVKESLVVRGQPALLIGTVVTYDSLLIKDYYTTKYGVKVYKPALTGLNDFQKIIISVPTKVPCPI